jgi:hypothetical protein
VPNILGCYLNIYLSSHDLPRIVTMHIREHRQTAAKVGTAYAGGRDFEQMFYGSQPHIALSSSESEHEYLRKLSEIIVEILMPRLEYNSDAIRVLIRELLTNTVLSNIVYFLSDPDYLNELLLSVIGI